MKTITILGFYHRNNLGDDLFMDVFTQSLGDLNDLRFHNPDDIKELPGGTDIVIIGGGDLINDYFMMKINKLLEGFTGPVYGIGVGFPYPNIINSEYLRNFDLILTRTATDATENRIYIPDLVTQFKEPPRPIIERLCNTVSKLLLIPVPDYDESVKVGFFLAKPIFQDVHQVYNLVKAVDSARSCFRRKYTVRLYSMNTQISNASECDLFLNNQIKYLSDSEANCLTRRNPFWRGIYVNHDFNKRPLSVFKEFDVAVCSRYHAHILAILTNTPFISISPTRKVKELLATENLTHLTVNINVNINETVEKNTIETDQFLEKLEWVVNNKNSIKILLKSIKSRWERIPSTLMISNLVEQGFITPKKKVSETLDIIRKRLSHDLKIDPETFTKVRDYYQHDPGFAVKVISFSCTGKIDSDYLWGLNQQILTETYDLEESIKWILERESQVTSHHTSFLTAKYPRKLNLRYFDTNSMPGLHRSGWSYIVENLYQMHSEKKIVIDLFSDRTFGWSRDFYKRMGLLPIRVPWIAVFHHTANQEYSDYNLVSCFKSELLQESLKTCKCIITLSENNREWICSQTDIPVINLKHPSKDTSIKFSFDALMRNPDRRVIQIGAWLRDTYAIYDLPILKNFRKTALKGKLMENYYLELQHPGGSPSVGWSPECGEISRGVKENKFVRGLELALQRRSEAVEIMDHCSDQEYDKLLSENVCFIKLIDASAVNTVIECIIRTTPIVVNRLPATQEYLGSDYPLFYETLEEAMDILNDLDLIKRGHEYLKRLDKTELMIEHFMHELSEIC